MSVVVFDVLCPLHASSCNTEQGSERLLMLGVNRDDKYTVIVLPMMTKQSRPTQSSWDLQHVPSELSRCA